MSNKRKLLDKRILESNLDLETQKKSNTLSILVQKDGKKEKPIDVDGLY